MFFLPVTTWYTSNSQRIRKMSESWAWENIYCPKCWSSIIQYWNNKPVADFYCKKCKEDFELKAKKSNTLWKIIPDGSYKTMIERLNSETNPSFFFLTYTPQFEISNFLIIPKFFIRPENILEAPRVLKDRGDYMMCNISLQGIPESWKIFYIKDKELLEKKTILESWEKTCFLQNSKWDAKWWLLDIIQCIESLWKKEFLLTDMQQFVPLLQQKHPNNNFIPDKIRQQLQVLRDKGYLEFKGRGSYKIN